MTMAKKLPLLAPSIHTFEVNGTYTDCEAKRTVFMAIQKMVSAGKYYRIPYHGSSKKGYSYKRKDGGLTITLADYPDFKKRYITLSGVNLARIAGDPSRLSLTDLSPEGLVMQEQAFLDELEQLGLLEIEESVKWKMHRLDITQDFYVKCDPSLMVKIIRYAGSVDPYRKGRALHYNQHNEIRSCKFEKTWYDFALYDKHQQLLNCEKESYPISPDDLERSKNLIRYEIQLKRPSLKEFEHDKLESSKLRFRNHALFHYFDKISDDIPFFLYRYAVDFFGKHSWYKSVVEREKGWFCENRECRFVLWKDNAFLKRLGKRMDAHVADKLLRDGRVRLKDCKSAKGKTYNATVLLSCEADGRSKFSLEFENGGC